MSISSNGRFIVNTNLARIWGYRVAGAYGLRLGVDFTTGAWDQTAGPNPVVMMHSATVEIDGPTRVFLGRAVPENPQPFTVTQFGHGPTGAYFELVLSKEAFEELEEMRRGGELGLTLRLCAEVRQRDEVHIEHDDLRASFNQSHWLNVLKDCGYQRTMLFEIPLPDEPAENTKWYRALESARKHFLQGHYAPAVSSCRMVLESLKNELGQGQLFKSVVERHKAKRTDLDVFERELVIRQAAFDFASLAVHPDDEVPEDIFDRAQAQMLLSVTASLVSSALRQQAEVKRRAHEEGAAE